MKKKSSEKQVCVTDAVDNYLDHLLPPKFCVHDEKTASWVVEQVTARRTFRKKVDEWAAKEKRRAEREEEFFWFRYGDQLERWARTEIALMRGRRSVNLPGGTVGFRKSGPLLVIEDDEAVLRWARSNLAAAVVVTEKLSKAVLIEHLKVTGEMPPLGARIEGPCDRFYIR